MLSIFRQKSCCQIFSGGLSSQTVRRNLAGLLICQDCRHGLRATDTVDIIFCQQASLHQFPLNPLNTVTLGKVYLNLFLLGLRRAGYRNGRLCVRVGALPNAGYLYVIGVIDLLKCQTVYPLCRRYLSLHRAIIDALLYFLLLVLAAVIATLRMTTLQKAWNVYSICSLYSSVQVIEIPPFLHKGRYMVDGLHLCKWE